MAAPRSPPCTVCLRFLTNPGTLPRPPARHSTMKRSMAKVMARKKKVRPTTSRGPPCWTYSGEFFQMNQDATTESTVMGAMT